jgi:luciferase family oxidoreductase group 1
MKSNEIAYSILELAIVSQGESFGQTLRNSVQLAEVAEQSGYRRMWFAEHHNSDSIGSSATTLLIGYIAENTKTLRVGSGGIMLPNHSPLIIAEQFGTLAHLYPGRIDLGLGRAPGTDMATAEAIRSDFMKAAHSFPAEVEKIQRYFSPENKRANVRAPIAEGVQVPLYILGSSTDSAHLAAEKGLPYAFASHFATRHLHEALEIYRSEFKPGAALRAPYTIAGINVLIADTEAEAQMLFTSIVRMFVGVLTGARAPLQPPAEMSADLLDLLQHPALQQMLKYSFVGSRETVKNELRDFIGLTKVDELIAASAMFNIDDRLKSARLFAEIMTELNAERR